MRVCISTSMSCFGDSSLSEEEREERARQKEVSKAIDQQIRKEKVEFKSTHRLLLLGEC